MNVVFLYTELADYFIKCCEVLAEDTNVHIICWPINKEAPFEFKTSKKIKVYPKTNYNPQQLVDLVSSLEPDVLVCSGWVDKDYLKIAKTYFKKIPTVLTCDTHWNGSIKQYAAIVLSRLFLLDRFSHAWVPGNAQTNYVKKLGFKPNTIHQGFYCCDLSKFNSIYETQKLNKQSNFPKRFLYVGRYYDFKGIEDLWKAFIEFQNEEPSEWELWCLGTGNITPINHPKIKHFGFVQPKDLEPIIEKTGVFILPSRFEPWGVVVQEYAAAGFPMILSKHVGAKEVFLEENKNGFSFQSSNTNDLKKQLKKAIQLSTKELLLMSEKSHEMSQKINQHQWSKTIINIYNGFKQN